MQPEFTAPRTGFATLKQGRQFLSVGRTTLYQMTKDGQIPTVLFRGAKRIPWAALHKLADDAARTVQLEFSFSDDED